jgi:hypothetical protein
MDASPERQEEAKRNFHAQSEAAAAIGNGVAVITDHGVEPFNLEEVKDDG